MEINPKMLDDPVSMGVSTGKSFVFNTYVCR